MYMAEDCLDWVQSVKVHLILKRLEAQETLEIWCRGGEVWRHPSGNGGGKQIWDVEQLAGDPRGE